ncbi:NUDIX domain-containing protein [Sulfitobacter albidus]|uniref:ADP-ribose pyrophosphatase n=1 Tax=Sulfitobacter albidus TaxID=2829501 RepID=A0A975JG83_9RHOB|nr:NUDIX domain-containing protein [Sulfitobacter albidus]QUJ77695.1 NUDIX domain-containing protein [Sulfitobacter albidus]
MTTLFFYGTLRHLPLLEIVLGRRVDPGDVTPATLPRHAARGVAEGPFPTLIVEEGSRARGLRVQNLTEQDIARLDFYEGGFDYDLVDVTLTGGLGARVYVSPPGIWTPTDPWDLDDWVARWAEMSCHAAREVMGYFGQRDRAQIAARFGQIRTRAWSKVLAGAQAPRQGTLKGRVDVADSRRPYLGFFGVEEADLRHSLFGGGMSAQVERSWLVGADAAIVLPYDPARDRVMVVEQMRVGPLGRGDAELWQLEPIAGRIDPGETPQEAAHREAQEEAGLSLRALEPVAECYASPGTTTDFFHIFVGLADLPDDATGIGGHLAEQEDIRSHIMGFPDFLAMAERRATANAPLTLLAYWLAHHRTRLRSAQGVAR